MIHTASFLLLPLELLPSFLFSEPPVDFLLDEHGLTSGGCLELGTLDLELGLLLVELSLLEGKFGLLRGDKVAFLEHLESGNLDFVADMVDVSFSLFEGLFNHALDLHC